jgi:hypothetical protein
VIFEFKAVKEEKLMEKAAVEALRQIEEKRYYAAVPALPLTTGYL